LTRAQRLAVLAIAFVAVLGLAAPALAHTVVTTTFSGGTGFRLPSSLEQEWGQVITVPTGETTLSSFTLHGGMTGGSATIQVYAWNGTQATGAAIYTSVATFSGITFTATVTPNIAVTSGAQYVVFEDVSAGSSVQLGHGNTSDSYAGGSAFYHQGAPTASAWTNTGSPFAFSATFDGAVAASAAYTHGAYCAAAPVPRADGTTGTFLDLQDGQPATDPAYAGASRASYGGGYGLTCDNLQGLGYTDAGYKVDGNGTHTGNPAWDVYEYFTKT
jgi:hypothetical protein